MNPVFPTLEPYGFAFSRVVPSNFVRSSGVSSAMIKRGFLSSWLVFCFMVGLILISPSSLASQILAGKISARAGETVNLVFHILPQPGHLLNKVKPMEFALEQPFGNPIKATLQAAYDRSFYPDLEEYYGILKPLEIQVQIPKNAIGKYTFTLKGQVRFCSITQHLCISDRAEIPYTLEIMPAITQRNRPNANLHAWVLVGINGTLE